MVFPEVSRCPCMWCSSVAVQIYPVILGHPGCSLAFAVLSSACWECFFCGSAACIVCHLGGHIPTVCWCVHVCLHSLMRARVLAFTHACTCACVHSCVHVCLHSLMRARVLAFTHASTSATACNSCEVHICIWHIINKIVCYQDIFYPIHNQIYIVSSSCCGIVLLPITDIVTVVIYLTCSFPVIS